MRVLSLIMLVGVVVLVAMGAQSGGLLASIGTASPVASPVASPIASPSVPTFTPTVDAACSGWSTWYALTKERMDSAESLGYAINYVQINGPANSSLSSQLAGYGKQLSQMAVAQRSSNPPPAAQEINKHIIDEFTEWSLALSLASTVAAHSANPLAASGAAGGMISHLDAGNKSRDIVQKMMPAVLKRCGG